MFLPKQRSLTPTKDSDSLRRKFSGKAGACIEMGKNPERIRGISVLSAFGSRSVSFVNFSRGEERLICILSFPESMTNGRLCFFPVWIGSLWFTCVLCHLMYAQSCTIDSLETSASNFLWGVHTDRRRIVSGEQHSQVVFQKRCTATICDRNSPHHTVSGR